MPKYKKDKIQRRRNAQKMHQIVRARRSQRIFPTSQLNDDANRLKATQQLEELNKAGLEEEGEMECLTQKPGALKNTGLDSTDSSDTENEELLISYGHEEIANKRTVGRRIIDVSHFITEIQNISNHGPLGCNVNELQLVGETQNGLESKFTIKCSLCNGVFYIDADRCQDNYLPMNKCAVAGTMAIGAGYSQLLEILASLNLPMMSEKTYINNHNFLSQKWQDVSVEFMKQAAEKERQHAISEKMEKKLISFYKVCILPELIDPYYPRGMPIRNPSYIEEVIKKKNDKNKENIKTVDRNKIIEKTDQETRRVGEEPDVLPEINMPTCSRYLDFEDT